MKRRVFLQSALGLGALAAGGAGFSLAGSDEVPLVWRERSLLGFGSVLQLRVGHRQRDAADRALDAAVATIRRIEAQMSLFRPDSALSRLNRDGIVHLPDGELVDVLRFARAVSERSGGAFDVTVQPLWEIFAAAHAGGSLPSADAVARARDKVDWRELRIEDTTIRFGRAGMAATLNGIAQGYAADRVRAQLQAEGIDHALINTGEWSALGQAAADREWTLGIADPRAAQALLARLAMNGRSIATSADNECAFSDDLRHHHVFDPRTGYSPAELASVTVAAPSCALADALTKVMLVAGSAEALRLAGDWQVDVLLVDKAGKVTATPGMRPQAV